MKALQATIVISAPVAAVWRALVGGEGVAALYFGCRLETTFAVGAPYGYVGDDGKGTEVTHVEGEVLACEENARLVLTHRAGPLWRKGGHAYTSRLAYVLEPAPEGTTLTVVQDQWEEGDPGAAHNARGWPVFLEKVKAHVESR